MSTNANPSPDVLAFLDRLPAFDRWRASPAAEEACAAIRRSDFTGALKEAFEAGQRAGPADKLPSNGDDRR